jgi:hypothetical protein
MGGEPRVVFYLLFGVSGETKPGVRSHVTAGRRRELCRTLWAKESREIASHQRAAVTRMPASDGPDIQLQDRSSSIACKALSLNASVRLSAHSAHRLAVLPRTAEKPAFTRRNVRFETMGAAQM